MSKSCCQTSKAKEHAHDEPTEANHKEREKYEHQKKTRAIRTRRKTLRNNKK